MTTIIAALDNSLAARPVLAAAQALAKVLDAQVEVLHVSVDGADVVRGAASAARLPLRTATGPVVDRLLEVGGTEDVAAVVLGARGTPGGRRPLGSTALAVATSLAKPIVVVPPDARAPAAVGRILVPLEGSVSSSLAARAILELVPGADVEVVVLHVRDEASLPAFTDQPQHEEQAWAQEFLARYCPSGLRAVRLEVRVGRCEEVLPTVAEETGADLIALGWAQELAPDRAPVVRTALARVRVPVMLIPVRVASAVTSVGV